MKSSLVIQMSICVHAEVVVTLCVGALLYPLGPGLPLLGVVGRGQPGHGVVLVTAVVGIHLESIILFRYVIVLFLQTISSNDI